ncbi:C40 family peptidase [Enterocloster clostridioformis]|uniref:Cell wall-associated hydrolases (Invasion-associated proteins) n=1 Tax=Enterocloster clostridioformis TaxID=1531 RepID=A0A2X2UD91_9FIRM|nr:C40 family peptidase [Enterocloster clostridioformis]MCA5581124.1 NlpC/P60 family protein [Enterocloster clostridioformis]SQB14378.1 Cell wall-associated hydrolases (invasion-associated proteins) [Enterocloster clostridioformis]
MKPLKPRDKVTQRMTRAGLTLDNQTTGESMNISSREAEPEYTAKSGGTAEKALERAVDIRDRHKAKQAARHGERIAKEASGPASRPQFTAEERASPELAPYIRQAEKRADRLDAAKSALPKKRVIAKATVYDETKGKARSKLHFEKVEKHPPRLKPNPASRPVQEAGLYLHGKIHEVEQENVGVEGGHKAEELAERQAGKALRNARRRHKLKPYRAAAKAERKSMAANAEFVYQKSLRDNPELAQAVSNPISRLWQKRHIKREYAKAARAAGRGTAGSAKTTASAARKAAEKGKQAASLVARHWKGALLIGGVGLLLMLIMGGLQSCTAMFGSAGTGLAATSYLSEDSDMLGAEASYAGMEADLQYELDHYETLHPGHDEYRFELDEIGHDPYVLTSILSALHGGVFTLDEVQGDLAMLFEQQYTLTERVEVEIRYRTVTHTDSDGNEYEEEVPYRYSICYVTLKNADLSHLPVYLMNEKQLSLYAAYMQTLGNRPDLFPSGSYPHASTVKEPTYYEIPPEALKDEAFAAMIAEAEKYVGFPYVWGGNSPSTSFDCSGFISWVLNHSGWSVGRQTAQGLYNLCTPVTAGQAKPGDLVFFVGTYDTPGVSHVGLYVGNSVMLHCGNPISYTNLNSSYWQSHLFCYGRLP